MAVEGFSQFARGAIALTAFLLLFLGIANASAGRYAVAVVTLAAGLLATAYVLRTREPRGSR